MDNDTLVLIIFVSYTIVMAVIIGYTFNRYFESALKQDEGNKNLHIMAEEEVISILPPEPIFGIYKPSIFSKKLTQDLYRRIVIYKGCFFDEMWMETLCEILSLLELADDVTVIKENGKVIHVVNGTRGMEGAQTAELYEAYNLYELSIKSLSLYIVHNSDNVEKFNENIIAILLFHIDEIVPIRHWSSTHDSHINRRNELVKYLSRKLSSDQQNYILELIEALDNKLKTIKYVNEILSCYFVAKSQLKTVTKLVVDNEQFDEWPMYLPTQRLIKEYLTLEQIERL
ncbi:hypothetical protein [Sulfuricurvum sp.]|uniref:hypothetical protein n=1 Tax=Sulfuricurvum sp. TaxID=2025608 RepID=UPI002604F800|nr:hypothetical protein [Sulfuricurvum sp.]MDD3594866.1 hypothetical protein [Sulfuricurvum sp.]